MPRPALIRPAAVAGSFYPSDPDELRAAVEGYLDAGPPLQVPQLAALVCPHAGFIYSGPTAGCGYRVLREQVRSGRVFERVVVMAPAHRVAFEGVAIADCQAFASPLGTVPLAPDCHALAKECHLLVDGRPHAEEHAIEVQLPFLQCVLERFELVPLVFGLRWNQAVAQALAGLADARTLFVVSTDLSHYLPYEQARLVDRETVEAFLSLDPERVSASDACGSAPATALAYLSGSLKWTSRLVDYRTSGDTAGDRRRVVGYAAFALSADQRLEQAQS